MISNRGTKVYPSAGAITDCVDHWFCRFIARSSDGAGSAGLNDEQMLGLLGRIAAHHRWTHLEKLHEFEGEAGFTKAQGED
ncbi:MAG TPA: isocitrate dehydrogenase, partial [Terriglobia bacterium]|nr:isocitrate dehydrogenase [Terriglobia bacterium]